MVPNMSNFEQNKPSIFLYSIQEVNCYNGYNGLMMKGRNYHEHTLAACVVMTSSACTVHALDYPILLYYCPIFCTCILTASVRMYYAALDFRVRFLCIFKCMNADRSLHIIVALLQNSIANETLKILFSGSSL